MAMNGIRMIKTLLYRALDRLLDGYVQGYMNRNVYKGAKRGIKAVRRFSDLYAGFSHIERWPDRVTSFEDMAFLFRSSQANYGLCLLAFDEAAYLYALVRTVKGGRLAEIGRFKGGSTFLMTAAMDNDSVLESFDVHKIPPFHPGKGESAALDGHARDSELREALARYGLESRVSVLIQDSATVNVTEGSYDLLFVDGDHSYEGASRDFNNWKDAIKKGGHMLFHDAARTRRFSSVGPGLARLMADIERDHAQEFEKVDVAGTLVHFRRLS